MGEKDLGTESASNAKEEEAVSHANEPELEIAIRAGGEARAREGRGAGGIGLSLIDAEDDVAGASCHPSSYEVCVSMMLFLSCLF